MRRRLARLAELPLMDQQEGSYPASPLSEGSAATLTATVSEILYSRNFDSHIKAQTDE